MKVVLLADVKGQGKKNDVIEVSETAYAEQDEVAHVLDCLLYTSPSPRDRG